MIENIFKQYSSRGPISKVTLIINDDKPLAELEILYLVPDINRRGSVIANSDVKKIFFDCANHTDLALVKKQFDTILKLNPLEKDVNFSYKRHNNHSMVLRHGKIKNNSLVNFF